MVLVYSTSLCKIYHYFIIVQKNIKIYGNDMKSNVFEFSIWLPVSKENYAIYLRFSVPNLFIIL